MNQLNKNRKENYKFYMPYGSTVRLLICTKLITNLYISIKSIIHTRLIILNQQLHAQTLINYNISKRQKMTNIFLLVKNDIL